MKQEQSSMKKGVTFRELTDMEEELEKQFPKGDKARGRALVLFALYKLTLADQKRRILNNVIRLISEADLKEFDKV